MARNTIYLVIGIIALVGVILFNRFTSQKDITCTDCNVIIVGYDTVGANHVSAMGYTRNTTPVLDSIARNGYLFTNNIAPAPWTVPSFMSLFTGMYPTEHKVINKFTIFNAEQKKTSNLSELSPQVVTLAQELKKYGYVTGGFTGDAGVSGSFGYKNGFDEYTDEQKFGSIENSANHALSWLKKNKDKKFFMFLHGYDAHGQFAIPKQGKFIPKDYSGQYTGSPQEEAKLREDQLVAPLEVAPEDIKFWNGLYDSKIYDGDNRFGKFWNEFVKMGLDKKTIVVVLSDHGEEYFEHKGIDHGHSLFDELLNVPLVFKIPGLKGGVKISQQVTSLDVVPTLFDILNITPSSQFATQIKGKSLVPLIEGRKAEALDAFIETDYRDFTHKRGIRTVDGWKYIITLESGKQELYNLNDDPKELVNVVKSHPEIASKLESKVKNHMVTMGQNPGQKWSVGCLPVYVGECE